MNLQRKQASYRQDNRQNRIVRKPFWANHARQKTLTDFRKSHSQEKTPLPSFFGHLPQESEQNSAPAHLQYPISPHNAFTTQQWQQAPAQTLKSRLFNRFSENWLNQEVSFSMNKLSLTGLVFGLMVLGIIFFAIGFLSAMFTLSPGRTASNREKPSLWSQANKNTSPTSSRAPVQGASSSKPSSSSRRGQQRYAPQPGNRYSPTTQKPSSNDSGRTQRQSSKNRYQRTSQAARPQASAAYQGRQIPPQQNYTYGNSTNQQQRGRSQNVGQYHQPQYGASARTHPQIVQGYQQPTYTPRAHQHQPQQAYTSQTQPHYYASQPQYRTSYGYSGTYQTPHTTYGGYTR